MATSGIAKRFVKLKSCKNTAMHPDAEQDMVGAGKEVTSAGKNEGRRSFISVTSTTPRRRSGRLMNALWKMQCNRSPVYLNIDEDDDETNKDDTKIADEDEDESKDCNEGSGGESDEDVVYEEPEEECNGEGGSEEDESEGTMDKAIDEDDSDEAFENPPPKHVTKTSRESQG